VAVRLECSGRATPKSAIFACPSDVRRMFAGLMSRWMMPFECAYARPRRISAKMPIASPRGSGRVRRNLARSGSPSTYSVAKYSTSSPS
jgi:hypothetical protein